MHPELIPLPIIGSLKTYGVFLCIGFLSAVWLGMRRAQRVKADPDVVLDIAFLSLVFGVVGARVFYVVHYWSSQFAPAPSPLLAAIDITGGGLEFLGGFLGALLAALTYARWKRISLRLYLDILAPSTLWGLGFGRLGCFFNGCCYGGLCIVGAGATAEPAKPWAVQFPYGSAAHFRHWEDRVVTVPAELIVGADLNTVLQPSLLPAQLLSVSVEYREEPTRRYEDARKRYQRASAKAPDAEETQELKEAMEAAAAKQKARAQKMGLLSRAMRLPSRAKPSRGISASELEELASRSKSMPIHPAQLYSSLHAFILSGVLSGLFYARKRHGVVIAALMILYPVPRTLLEVIRSDNPHDVGGLTISQFVSLGLLVVGLVALFVLFTRMPERSPLVDERAAEA